MYHSKVIAGKRQFSQWDLDKWCINTQGINKLSIAYDRNLKIETNIAEAIVEKMEENDGIYILPSREKYSVIYFAIVNCDLQNHTPD